MNLCISIEKEWGDLVKIVAHLLVRTGEYGAGVRTRL